MLSFTNRLGLRITLSALDAANTRVAVGDNGTITVAAPAERIRVGLSRWIFDGAYLQDALGFLSPDEREFLLTGITPAKWGAIFPPEDVDA